MKKLKAIKDFALRMSSSVLTTIANQLVLLPVLASMFPETYGSILTIIGVKNVISGTLGNSLFSTRLIMEADYEKKRRTGDFNILICIATIISAIAMYIAILSFDNIDESTKILMILIVIIFTLNAYFTVWYTVKLQFTKGLVHSIIVSFGTLIGVLLVRITGVWPIAYISTALAGLVFVLTQTGILREGFRCTDLFKKTTGKWIILLITTLLTNLVTYLDRLLLYPLLGDVAVSTFSVATYFGKALSVIAMPIASVMLGYYAQKDYKMNLKRFWTINAICGGLLAVFTMGQLFFGHMVTGWLFPKQIESAAQFIFIGNLATSIAAILQIVQSASMKYAKTYWQIVIQVCYLLIYFVGGIFLTQLYGLMGFCMASLITNVVRLGLLLIVSHVSIGKMEKEV